MSDKKASPYVVRPPTAVLTRGYDPSLSVGSARPAVFRSSTYVFSSPEAAERAFALALGRAELQAGESPDLIYSRLSHPNAEILEDQIVPLEPDAQAAAVFNSGLSAISTVMLTFLSPGDHYVYTHPVYGGTHHLFKQLLDPLGFVGREVLAGDTVGLLQAVAEEPHLRIVFIETPSNPTLKMSDIQGAVDAARKRSKPPLVVVDNTFLGPTFQHPLKLGADVAVYSATKFLAGFSDMLGGVMLSRDPDLVTQARGTRALLGTILQPDECWLLDSRLPTVRIRMNRQSKNAERIVRALHSHERVKKIYYPALYTDPEQKRIRDAQCSFPGSVFAFEIDGGKKEAFDFLRKLKIAHNAVSLGGMETLVCHPMTTVHSEMEPEEAAKAGITDRLIRLSIGIEDWRDILHDIQQALD